MSSRSSSPRVMKDTLRHIVSVSLDLVNSLPLTSINRCTSSHQGFPIANCNLPEPQPLDLDFGLDSIFSEKISSAYLRAATELKAGYEKRFLRVCRGVTQFRSPLCPDATRLQLSLRSAYISEYTNRLSLWAEEVKTRILRARQRQTNVNANSRGRSASRRTFSQHVIDVLVEFFERNAFPSRSEKHHLATETNMQYSQVHIWFQNRRRRFRKEGKELKKADPKLILPSELDTSVAELLALAEPDAYLGEKGIDSTDAHDDILNPTAPPHAFPSAYPPTCSYDPFPIEEGVRKLTTPWIRKSSTARIGCPMNIDIAQLTASFRTLNLIDEPRSDLSHILSPSRGAPRLQYELGFATIVPSAPHPALVRSAVAIPSVFCAKATAQSNRMMAPHSQTPVPQTKKANLRRKVVPLPKRMPTSASVTHRGPAPAIPEPSTVSSISILIPSPAASTSSADVTVLRPSYARTIPVSADQTPLRKVAALPKRASTRSTALPNLPSSSQFLSMSVRTPSASSSTSSGSSSPSGLDTPLSTPPSLPVSLPSSKISTSRAMGSSSSVNSLFSQPSTDERPLIEGLQLWLNPMVRIAS